MRLLGGDLGSGIQNKYFCLFLTNSERLIAFLTVVFCVKIFIIGAVYNFCNAEHFLLQINTTRVNRLQLVTHG